MVVGNASSKGQPDWVISKWKCYLTKCLLRTNYIMHTVLYSFIQLICGDFLSLFLVTSERGSALQPLRFCNWLRTWQGPQKLFRAFFIFFIFFYFFDFFLIFSIFFARTVYITIQCDRVLRTWQGPQKLFRAFFIFFYFLIFFWFFRFFCQDCIYNHSKW